MQSDEYTNQEFFLDVGDGHQLYVQDWGIKDAKRPIIFLHGGPGTGLKEAYKTTFEPTLQRVIFFDQRGTGKSLPYGSLKNNTTHDLVEDIEKLAKHLKLPKFIITGGSWGSCLALAYAIKYPDLVEALVLRGIFTGRKSEIDWLEKGGYRNFFPDVWQGFVDDTPKAHTKDPAAYHVPRILGDDESAVATSAYALGKVEGALLSLDDRYTPSGQEEYDPTFVKIESHYMANKCFMPDSYILDNAGKINAPVWLIQGRYDMVCPPITAYELDQRLPDSHLIWTVAGHSNDRGNYDVNRTILLQMAGE